MLICKSKNENHTRYSLHLNYRSLIHVDREGSSFQIFICYLCDNKVKERQKIRSPINVTYVALACSIPQEWYLIYNPSTFSLCGLLVASTAAFCARRAAARSSLHTDPILYAFINALIESSSPCVAEMTQCFTALSSL